MSKLYASMDSDATRTTATKRGHRNVSAHLRGWEDGCEVFVQCDDSDRVQVEVWRTNGSNNPGQRELVCSWREGAQVMLARTYAVEVKEA